MKIFHAILISLFLIATAQAETLTVSGKFKSVISVKGYKPEKISGRDSLYIYEDGSFEDAEGDFYGTYIQNGNTYILNLDDDSLPGAIAYELAYQDIYIDAYTPFQMLVKFNKKRTKATVKMRTSIWAGNDYGDQVKVSIKIDCACSAKKQL